MAPDTNKVVSSETNRQFESSLDEMDVMQSRTSSETLQQELKRTVLKTAKTGVSPAAIGIASYGTLVIEDTPGGAESVSLFPDLHVAVVRASDIVESMSAAFERLGPLIRDEGSSAILETGPSATADMGALVRGAHGPENVHVIIITDR
jgi:L-lactate dehydrogenase complex protein LldG